MKLRDLTGEKFGRLTVVSRDMGRVGRKVYWNCQCSCGQSCSVESGNLTSGRQVSCGCYGRESRVKHGMSGESVYHVWEAMIGRCTNPRHQNAKHYHDRGISVCDRWRDFTNFYADMGDQPKGYTLERLDNEKGYSPSNCAWVTRKDQARNKRGIHLVTYDGKTQVMLDWAHEFGISPSVLRRRLLEWGWPMATALTTPVAKRGTPRDVQEEGLRVQGFLIPEAVHRAIKTN